MEKNGVVRLGVDDFIQHLTGNITRIILKNPGEFIKKGDALITLVRNGKHITLFSPVSGTVRKHNPNLEKESGLINSSPYNEGWIYEITPSKWLREIQYLFLGKEYRDWISDEFARLKEFLSAAVRVNENVYAHVVMQDGGELTDHVLAELDPEVWEEFQNRFINTSR
jgi:glycine cleavage system H lipoate-binding protein